MANKIAAIDNISYMYPRSEDFVLDRISLDIYAGEFLGLIGPTGAGKTTLCLALNGIVPQFYGGRFYGNIQIAGMDTLHHPISKLARYVGEVFEDPETQLVATSVQNEIAFAMENLKFDREEILARIPEVLAAVRLEGTEQKHPAELSGGQKQRLAIAAALAVQPDLMVLDEPTSQLDPVGAEEVFSTVRELNRHLGKTIVMVSHAAEEMAEFVDRLAFLSHGELIACGTPEEIYSDIELLTKNDLRPPQVASTFYLINQKTNRKIADVPVQLDKGKDEIVKIAKMAEFDLSSPLPDPKKYSNVPLFSVKDLKHVYPDGTEALHGISLDICEGEYVLIIGQNGAGKSTLVKHFLHLLSPTSGTVTVAGKDLEKYTVGDLARRIGYIAQNPDYQIFNATVEEEISFALKNLEFPAEIVKERTEHSLESMGLTQFRDRHPLSLPKGDRARVVIAAILAMQPEIIIFDEPTTGQDYRGARYILELSRQLHEMGKTVIVITHHLYLMPGYAERAIVMGKGTILMDGPIRDVYHRTELLGSTFLTPPQAVLLSQELGNLNGREYPFLTPEELSERVILKNREV
ncbi:MAG: ATP-binding cassette domain-containing protein [Anaerolineaceae bacterium]|nr:ATP-binding cassette domain-containing protein [Anaerolineaceae bacterium]